MNDNLEPCPFCKSVELRTSYLRATDELQWHEVNCPKCFMRGPPKTTELEAIAAWNTRQGTANG